MHISLRTRLIVSFLAVVIVTGFVATLVGVNLLQKLSMPANYRGDIIFISDSQGFYKEGKAPEECLNAMIDEFTGYWAPIFYFVRRKAPCFSYGDISRQFLCSCLHYMKKYYTLLNKVLK
ncbi:MAG: hypothetical protein KJ568_04085 [Actinobacteria bacterium]|nr:hypothetical protein [Actinomycetota bacterium]